MQSTGEVVVTPPGRAAIVFSGEAQITRDPANVMYFYVRPGENPSTFVREHAALDHIVR